MAISNNFTKTEIVISDYNDGQPVAFYNLSLYEGMINVNSFSFLIRIDNNDGNWDAILNLKQNVLGKDITIKFKAGDGAVNHIFKGVILDMASSLAEGGYYNFTIKGQGSLCKHNYIPVYRSFYKKDIKTIIDTVTAGTALAKLTDNQPQETAQFHYIVQYNQPNVEFLASLAVRMGEWMYYDGEKMIFGPKPTSDNSIELDHAKDITQLTIHANSGIIPDSNFGMDIFKSEKITSSKKENIPSNPYIKAALESGNKIFKDENKEVYTSHAFNEDYLENRFITGQRSTHSSVVELTAGSKNSRLSPGKVISITDQQSSTKKFIITQIQHLAYNATEYSNTFMAIPYEVSAPQYTNANWVPQASAQPAIVTKNEDKKGLARIKVRFPWMGENDETPWISVLSPHAGKGKGFRFLPEIDDEVLVDFWDNNAEKPYVSGAIYTDKNKPDIPEQGNDVKIIGTRSARRIVFDDKNGELYVQDFEGNDKGNIIKLTKTDNQVTTHTSSGIDDKNFSIITVDGEKGISIGIRDNGEVILSLIMDKDKKSIAIKADKNISITAKGGLNLNADEINLNATNINLNAKDNIDIKADTGIHIDAVDVKVEANANLEIGAVQVKIETDAQLDMKSSGITSVQGSLVKIN